MRSPVNGHEAVYEWHQKRAHELVAGLGVTTDGHAWHFGEPVEGGPSYHARVKTCVSCEERIGPWVSVNGGPNLEFSTAVLGPASSQRDVYTECAEPLLEAALGGQDSCLFAYGQTGAGKP